MKSAQEKRRTEIESEEKVNRKLLLANASCCYLSRKHATFGEDSHIPRVAIGIYKLAN